MNTPDTPPIVAIEGLSKVFRDFWRRPKVRAVDNLSLVVQPGEVLGLLGPNGSGKSTTIKMVLGLLRPTHGRIQILGKSPEDPTVRARIGYLPELSHLYHYLTPRETLDFYGGLFDLPRRVRRQRTEELLAMVDLTEVADRPVGEFSKGMARRVGLAQALLNNPDLVILDEPTSGLDPIGRHQVKSIVRTLARGGKTVLLSSHLLAEIEDVCDRVAILFRGRLQAEGRLEHLLARHEQVRLTLAALDSEHLNALCAEIAQRTGSVPAVDRPAMTLEQYFLEVVAHANGERAAAAPAAVARFLDAAAPGAPLA